jgi:lysozyme
MNNYKVDAAGRAFLTREEGEVLHEYLDAGGKPTIGVGHLLTTYTKGRTITHEQSQQLLTADLARFEAAVNRLVRGPLNQHQFNALVSFAFNLGEGALTKSSLLRLVNAGSIEAGDIREAFRIWRNVNGKPNAGIETRRLREAALFLTH